jgi:hypothetical protein
LVFKWRYRPAAPVFFTTTIRGLAVLWLICSYGSCVPVCRFVEPATIAVPALFSRNRS